MWYTQAHETTHFCSRSFRRRTKGIDRRITFSQRVCASSQPDLARLGSWGNAPQYREGALAAHEQTARHAIHAFNQEGREALQAGSSRPHHLPTVLREDVTTEMFKAVLHRPPRDFGFETSLWTLDLLVKQCVRLGWMTRSTSIETMRQTLLRLGINWKRAKHWLTSPDPLYQEKKALATDC